MLISACLSFVHCFRYLDMNALHQQYLNLKGVTYIDYITYLASFDRLFEYPRENKNAEYKKYLKAIVDYFYDFYTRAMPLHDIEGEISALKEDFETKWANGSFPGWGKDGSGVLSQTGTRLDLSAFSSPEELMSLGAFPCDERINKEFCKVLNPINKGCLKRCLTLRNLSYPENSRQ